MFFLFARRKRKCLAQRNIKKFTSTTIRGHAIPILLMETESLSVHEILRGHALTSVGKTQARVQDKAHVPLFRAEHFWSRILYISFGSTIYFLIYVGVSVPRSRKSWIHLGANISKCTNRVIDQYNPHGTPAGLREIQIMNRKIVKLVGGIRYEARSRGRSSPDFLAF